MNCELAQQELAIRRDDEVTGRDDAALRAHLETCADCRAYAADVARMRALCAEFPRPAVPERIRQSVRDPDGMVAVRRRWLAAAAVLVAVLGLWGASGIRQPGTVPAAGDEKAPAMRTVVFGVESRREQPAVMIRLLLPPGVEVQGHPGRSVLEWTDSLAMGVNRLRVPLLLVEAGMPVRVTAQVEYEGTIRELEVIVGGADDAPVTQTGVYAPGRLT